MASGCGDGLLAPDAGPPPDSSVTASSDSGRDPAGPDAAAPGPDASAPGPDAQLLLGFVRAMPNGGEEAVTVVHWGDPYRPVASGLPAGAEVTLRARADVVNVEYEAWGQFKVGADGTLDPRRDAPVAGTWSGADFEGPIWSAAQAEDGQDLLPFNVLEVRLSSATAPALASARLDRYYLDARVVKTVVPADTGLVAELYALPEAVGRPAVIVFGGSEGGISSARYDAWYLSSKGTPALALAYFGLPGLASRLGKIQLETWDRAYQWLAARPEVDPSKVVVMGGSRGGEAALAVGASFAWVRGVVAVVPSGVSWPGTSLTLEEYSSWTLGGVGLPWIPSDPDSLPTTSIDPDGVELTHYRVTFEDALELATSEQLDAATFRVEDTQGRVVILAGADDQLWPSCGLGQLAWERLPESHRLQHQDELWCVAQAGHSFPTPGSPTVGAHRVPDPYGGGYLALGGTPAGTAHAARLADERIQALLESL